MDKYHVVLYSKVDDDATVSLTFIVNTDMSPKQLKWFYECKSLSISNVEVYDWHTKELLE